MKTMLVPNVDSPKFSYEYLDLMPMVQSLMGRSSHLQVERVHRSDVEVHFS